ncbi:MAG: hypothetical protein U0736_00695 [Gemmataceae bacterium]
MPFRLARATRRRFVPTLEALEARWTPASATYNPVTQQLTIVADSDDTITVSQAANKPTGFLQVTDGSSTIFSGTAFVRHLRADLRNDQFSNFFIADQTRIAGNVTVISGPITGAATLGASAGNGVWIGGSFSYFGTGTANDNVTIEQLCIVAGGVNIYAGEGQNYSSLKGYHYGSLYVSGGSSNDIVNVPSLSVGGNLTLALGGGPNSFAVTTLLQLGGSLSYTGGNGVDSITVPSAGKFNAGGSVVLNLGPALGADGSNSVNLQHVTTAGALTVNGGNGTDSVWIEDDVFIGTDLNLLLRGGANTATVDFDTTALYVKRNLTYTGGSDRDEFNVGDIHVNGNLTVALGDNVGASGQELDFGGGIATIILGSVTATGGRHTDLFDIEDAIVGKSVSVNGGIGGGDSVYLDNSVVSGNATLITGAGADNFDLDGLILHGNLTILSGGGADTVSIDEYEVQGATWIDAGTGDDTIRVEEANNTTPTSFGNAVTFIGGTGVDTLRIGQAPAHSSGSAAR